MPLGDAAVRVDLACGRADDGRWLGWYVIRVDADALRRLGLHPDQPTAHLVPTAPAWWHADAERRHSSQPSSGD